MARKKLTQEEIDALVNQQIAERQANIAHAEAMRKAWFDLATASDLEELEAGRPPKSYENMREAYMELSGWNDILPERK